MTYHSRALVLASVTLLTGCPGDDAANAETVWLAPDGAETRVKLAEGRPAPF